MKTPYSFRGVQLAGLLSVALLCLATPLEAQKRTRKPATTEPNPDGGTTTTEEVKYPRKGDPDFDPKSENPFDGKGDRKTTRDKDGKITKVEFVKRGKVRRAWFFKKEQIREPLTGLDSDKNVVTRYDYNEEGKETFKGEQGFDGYTGKTVSREEQRYDENGKVRQGSQYRLEKGKLVYYSWDPKSESWVRQYEAKEGFGTFDEFLKKNDLENPFEDSSGVSGAIPTDLVSFDISGTGETIGHVANIAFTNLSDKQVSFKCPAMILESPSGENQNYACLEEKNVKLKPKQKLSVPIDGVCLNRDKPPLGKGKKGDLVINEANPRHQNRDAKIKANDAAQLLYLCSLKYEASEKVQKDGALKKFPYKDKKKQLDILRQWSIWSDPEISELTGSPPATRDDLEKVAYKQIEEKGPMTPDTKKKVDEGLDSAWEGIELTTKKAKDLEEEEEEDEETPAGVAP